MIYSSPYIIRFKILILELCSQILDSTNNLFDDLNTKIKICWMDFQVLNLEREPPASLRSTYNFAIGTNAVHAISNVVSSTSRMRSFSKKGGFTALS